MTVIYFVRHGQASYGAANYDQLSVKGEQQAQYLGQYLPKILDAAPHAIAGAMQRHQQTATASLAHFPEMHLHIDARWNEFNHEEVFKKFEQCPEQVEFLNAYQHEKVEHPRRYLGRIFTGAMARWTAGQHDADYAESWLSFRGRVENALHDVITYSREHRPESVVVFSSGGVISVLTGLILGLSEQKIFELNWSVVNTSLTSVKVTKETVQLLSFNEHHHLHAHDADLVTWI